MTCHKTSLNKCLKSEVISSIFTKHNAIKLEMNKNALILLKCMQIKLTFEQPMDQGRSQEGKFYIS
jgi:hypothetical protein